MSATSIPHLVAELIDATVQRMRTMSPRHGAPEDDQSLPGDEYVLVTEYFYPDQLGTGRLMTDLATGLRERGLDLTVYTGQPHYFGNDNERQPRRTLHEGVPVRRIRAPQVPQASLLHRLFNWTVFTVWMALALLLRRSDRPQRLIFVTNPPFLPIAMWIVCAIRGWPYTYIVHDLYPDVAVESGHIPRDGVIHRVWSGLNARALAGATDVVVLGDRMQDRTLSSAGGRLDNERLSVIPNWEDESFIKPIPKDENWFSREHDLVDQFVVTYSGNIGANHDLHTLVRAADRLRDSEVKFLVIGEGDNRSKVIAHAEQLGLTADVIEFLPFQDRRDLPFSLTCGDVSVVSVSDGMKGLAVSSKVYTSLATGQPVLVLSDPDDDEAETVRRYNAGTVVRQGDTDGIVSAIETWMADPDLVREQGENARRALEKHFTESLVIDRYHKLLTDSAVGTGNRSEVI